MQCRGGKVSTLSFSFVRTLVALVEFFAFTVTWAVLICLYHFVYLKLICFRCFCCSCFCAVGSDSVVRWVVLLCQNAERRFRDLLCRLRPVIVTFSSACLLTALHFVSKTCILNLSCWLQFG